MDQIVTLDIDLFEIVNNVIFKYFTPDIDLKNDI